MADDSERADESAPETLKRFVEDVGVLIRSELELAREEMVEKAKTAGLGAGMLGGAALGGTLTIVCLTALSVIVLSLVVPLWVAVFIVTVVWGSITAALALLGKRKIQKVGSPLPDQTITNIKEDLRSAQEARPPARK